MKTLFTILILATGMALYSQSATPPAEINPSYKVGRPRPAPPSCCRPFRTINGIPISIFETSSAKNAPKNQIYYPTEIEQYRISLEAYRENIEQMRKEGKITPKEYIDSLVIYRNRIKEYTNQYKRLL